MTPGNPTMVAPVTSRPGAFRWTRYQGEGIENSRWGSFAKIGLPVTDRDPAMAQALEPGCGSLPPAGGNRNSTFARSPDANMRAFRISARQLEVSVRYISRP